MHDIEPLLLDPLTTPVLASRDSDAPPGPVPTPFSLQPSAPATARGNTSPTPERPFPEGDRFASSELGRRPGPMHVISASRRTDIPAFYARWLMNRVRAGYCAAANPFSGHVCRISLRPEDVVAIVFWTRNPLPLMPYLDELECRGYQFLFHFTLTGYSRSLDVHGPDPLAMTGAFRRLADRVGPTRVLWRYDPIVLTNCMDADWHRRNFATLCGRLAGATQRCYVSFIQLYHKSRARLDAAARAVPFRYGCVPVGRVAPPAEGWFLEPAEMRALAADLGAIAREYGLRLYSCCGDALVDPAANVYKAHCVDAELIAGLRPDLDLALEPRPTRDECGCFASRDIGAYDTCAHGCVYCYAVRDPSAARTRVRSHDPEAEALGALAGAGAYPV